jgi:hypothetical protein
MFEMLLDLESGTPDHTLMTNAAYRYKCKRFKKFVDKCVREKQMQPPPDEKYLSRVVVSVDLYFTRVVSNRANVQA